MKDYIFSIISFSALGTVALGLLPAGEGVLKKTFVLLLSLIMILVIEAPLVSSMKKYDASFFSELINTETYSYEEVWLKNLGNLTKNEADAAVLLLISNEYSLSENEIEVDCTLKQEENAFSLLKVNVFLSGKGMLVNPSRVESFLENKLCCECTVK